MSDLLSPLMAELKTRVASVWTDVAHVGTDGATANHVYEVEHATMIPAESMDLPAAYIVLNEEQPANYGMDNLAHMVPVEVYYVATVTGPAGLAVLRAKVSALASSLWTTALTAGQVIEEPRCSANARLMVNVLFQDRKTFIRAGRVLCPILIGETI